MEDLLIAIENHNADIFDIVLKNNPGLALKEDEDGLTLMYYAIQNYIFSNYHEDAKEIITILADKIREQKGDPMFQGSTKVPDIIALSAKNPNIKKLITEGVFRRSGGRRRKSRRSKRKARKTRRR
jgi:hypothetical protein